MFSILIPMYNVAPYIERCINSVMGQDYKGAMECIIVDDCSIDGGVEIVRGLIDSYIGPIDFKFILHECNKGVSYTRNVCVKHAIGDYIYFLDGDDELPLNALSLFAREVEKYPGVDMIMGYMQSSTPYPWYNLDEFRGHEYVTNREYLQYKLFYDGFRLPVNIANKLVRKQFIIENNLRFFNGIIHEDNQWMFHIVKYINSFAFIYETTYLRYWNDNSITSIAAVDVEKDARSWHRILLDVTDNLYDPFKKLQIYKYTLKYADCKMNRYDFPDDIKLRNNLITNAMNEGMITLVLFFKMWLWLDSIGIKRGSIRLMNPIRKMYHNESMKYADIYK